MLTSTTRELSEDSGDAVARGPEANAGVNGSEELFDVLYTSCELEGERENTVPRALVLATECRRAQLGV